MILPYYKLQKTKEDKKIFNSHKGYFNLWDEYLILHLGYDIVRIVVNRPKTKFNGHATKEQDENFNSSIAEHFKEHKPEEMFEDFPELENIKMRYINSIFN